MFHCEAKAVCAGCKYNGKELPGGRKGALKNKPLRQQQSPPACVKYTCRGDENLCKRQSTRSRIRFSDGIRKKCSRLSHSPPGFSRRRDTLSATWRRFSFTFVMDGGHEEVMKRPIAKGIARVYSVCKWTVYRLAEQKRTTDIVALRTSQRGRKPVLTAIQ